MKALGCHFAHKCATLLLLLLPLLLLPLLWTTQLHAVVVKRSIRSPETLQLRMAQKVFSTWMR